MSLNKAQAQMLAAVADELKTAGADVRAFEALAANLVRQVQTGNPSELEPDVLGQIQGLDGLIQRLEAVSQVVALLSQGADVDQAVEAVWLSDLAARLRGDVRSGEASPVAAGDVSFF